MNFRKIYEKCNSILSFEDIYFKCNVKPLSEQILRESGGSIGVFFYKDDKLYGNDFLFPKDAINFLKRYDGKTKDLPNVAVYKKLKIKGKGWDESKTKQYNLLEADEIQELEKNIRRIFNKR